MLERNKTDGLGLNGQCWPLGKSMPETRVEGIEGLEKGVNKVNFKTGLLMYMLTILNTEHWNWVESYGETIRKR
jgi:hypothetical protein